MEDLIIFHLPFTTQPHRAYVQATECVADLHQYTKAGWALYVRQDIKTVEPFVQDDMPEDAKLVRFMPEPVDVMHLIGPVSDPTLLLEAQHCTPRVVRVGGSPKAERNAAYATGLHRTAMLLRGQGYQIYRVRGSNGVPTGLDADDRSRSDASAILAFSDQALADEAHRIVATIGATAERLQKTLAAPEVLKRAHTYIGLLEDALMALQGQKKGTP
jgi:hypothetical protein